MAEIARDAVLFGGKDLARAEAYANALESKLKAAGCDEAGCAGLTRKAASSLSEARSVTVVLASEGDGGAADVYAAAAAARPDRPEALLALAELYAARGKIDEALDFAKKGKLQAPGDDRAAALLRELLTIWRDSLDETQVLADALEHEARV